MVSRIMGTVVSVLLPVLAMILPFGPAHRVNAVISGLLATALAAVGLGYRHARFAAAIVGGWVAAFSLFSRSSLIEGSVGVTWGAVLFFLSAGPFNEKPRTVGASDPAPRLPSTTPPRQARRETTPRRPFGSGVVSPLSAAGTARPGR